MTSRPRYKTIVISDVHLGSTHSKVNEVSRFLASVDCERLILNGDIIDGWQLQKSGIKKWKHEHTRFFKVLMKMMENHDTEIIYVRGNHDDFLDALVPFSFAGIRVVRDCTIESGGKRYFVTHGDAFDRVTTHLKWMARLGDAGYTLLLWVNGHYNRWRARRGKPYHSISQVIKQKVKRAVNYISDFEGVLADFARSHGCEGVICGHIHHPDNRLVNGIHYLNSGDWVETLSALAETEDGKWSIVYYPALATGETPATEQADADGSIAIAL